MPKYWEHFQESWKELEDRFHRKECKPVQENDVVCYIYHALLNRLEKDKHGFKPLKIKTEYSLTLKTGGRKVRIDMNIDNKLFVEFMMIGRKSRIGLDKKKEIEIKKKIENLAEKLLRALKKAGHPSKRQPVIALWDRCDWKTSQEKGIHKNIIKELNQLGKQLPKKKNGKVRFIFGPKTNS